MARRRRRSEDFLDLLVSFPERVMPHYRPAGPCCQPESLPCATGGRVAVFAAFAGLHFRCARVCCRSSVVEHPLGKGEVECSIHSGSTSKISTFSGLQGAPRYGRFSLGYTVGYTANRRGRSQGSPI